MAVNFDDLSEFDAVTPANAGAWLTLLDVNDKPTKRRMKLLGVNSEVWQSDNYSDANQRQRAIQKTGKAIIETTEQAEERLRKRVAKMCVTWEGFSDEGGGLAPCTKENVYAVLSHPKVGKLIFNQALEFILEPSNHGDAGEKAADPRLPEVRMGEIAGNSEAGQNTNTAASLSSGTA